MSDDEDAPKPRVTVFTDDQISEFEEAFEILDRDSDKKITVSEMKTLLNAVGLPFQSKELEEMCSRMDQTGNNIFEFDEFLTVAEHFWKQINMEEQVMKAFKAFEDDDGRMKDDYFFKVLTKMGTPFTQDELKQLKWLMHKDDPPNASGEDFKIVDFVKMLYAPKTEEEDD